jgi:pyridoxal biosynthesis lyase PdxS
MLLIFSLVEVDIADEPWFRIYYAKDKHHTLKKLTPTPYCGARNMIEILFHIYRQIIMVRGHTSISIILSIF